MWDLGDFNGWTGFSVKRKRKKRRSSSGPQKRSKKAEFRLYRVAAEVRYKANPLLSHEKIIVKGRFFLNDLNIAVFHLFTEKKIPKDASVSITIDDPIQFYIQGIVEHSEAFNLDSPVISPTTYPYRTSIRLLFQSSAEKNDVRAYFGKIMEELVCRPAGALPPATPRSVKRSDPLLEELEQVEELLLRAPHKKLNSR